MTGALSLLVRISLAVAVTLVVAAVRLLLGAGRLGLWLLALAGFRGARLVALAATGVGVWWAAGQVGLRPAVWLAVIAWAAWAMRHHRAAIRQHAAVRRLTAPLQHHANTLAAAGPGADWTAGGWPCGRGRRPANPLSRRSQPWAATPRPLSPGTPHRPAPPRPAVVGGTLDDQRQRQHSRRPGSAGLGPLRGRTGGPGGHVCQNRRRDG